MFSYYLMGLIHAVKRKQFEMFCQQIELGLMPVKCINHLRYFKRQRDIATHHTRMIPKVTIPMKK